MAEKKKILYIVEAMGGGVFTYIVDLANELVNEYDMYIAYAIRKRTSENYQDILNIYNTKVIAKRYAERYEEAISEVGLQHKVTLYALTNYYATVKVVA